MNAHVEKMAREAGLAFDAVADGLGTESTAEYRLEAFAKAIAEDCAKLVAPAGNRPCDCDICDCGNSGDLRAVTDWDTSNALAKAIRERYK